MPTYYQFINGQRYDASLIQHAQSSVSGRGDGRISQNDAQRLWDLAMDGGRITATEFRTLRYLLKNLTWTEVAQSWMEAALNGAMEQLMSYYKIIDGLRYDRRILEKAEELTDGRGDGRISREDAEKLLPLFGDKGSITIEEERSLYFLLDKHNWTNAAKEYMVQQIAPVSKESDVFHQINQIFAQEFDLSGLVFEFIRAELSQQILGLANQITFPEAVWRALDNLLHYKNEHSLVWNLVHWHKLKPKAKYRGNKLENLVREYLKGGRLVLLPGNMESEPSLANFPSPFHNEKLADNWCFGLELFDISDDVYWVIVPRNGDKAYNYVGGPNYEPEWPRT